MCCGARFGLCPAIASIHTIQGGEEIFVRYGYDLDFCPDWYLTAWEQGDYVELCPYILHIITSYIQGVSKKGE